MALTKALHERDQLLLVFVHGFRGSEASFYDFPDSVRTVLTNSLQIDVDAVVYPSYRTQGSLKQAVDGLGDWLIEETQKREAEIKRLGGNGQVLVVLMAHSMGGIVCKSYNRSMTIVKFVLFCTHAVTHIVIHSAADTILHFQPPENESQKSTYSLSRNRPNIIGLIAYDTPFYSLNHNVVSGPAWERFQQVHQTYSTVSTGYQIMSSILPASAATATAAASSSKKMLTDGAKKAAKGGRWGLFAGVAAGVAATAAVATTAYMQRDRVTEGVTYLTEHLQFVSALAHSSDCRSRVEKLARVPNLVFRCFYTRIPANDNKSARTFIAAPPKETARFFEPADSSADGEITAHTGMFDPSTNSNCYTLRGSTVDVVTTMVHKFEEWREHQTITGGDIADDENTTTDEKVAAGEDTTEDEKATAEADTTAGKDETAEEKPTADKDVTAEEKTTVDKDVTSEEKATADKDVTAEENMTVDKDATTDEKTTPEEKVTTEDNATADMSNAAEKEPTADDNTAVDKTTAA